MQWQLAQAARALFVSSAIAGALACAGGGERAALTFGPNASRAPAPSALEVIAHAPTASPEPSATGGPAVPSSSQRRFPPSDIEPPAARSADAGDGRWTPLGATKPGQGEPVLYTTLLHPHESSRFIALTLVAIDLSRLRLELVPGVDDVGKQVVPFAPGLVPERDQAGLVAAFNGGFMPQHGRWGMRVGDTTLLPPREQGCTVALFRNGDVQIRAWPVLAPRAGELRALRQTPPCLLEAGELNADLLAGRDRAWAGRTPGIVTRRRSAVGLSEDGLTLYYALGVEASPKLLASGLRAAGAAFAAQLDINWNWTRFLLFDVGADGKAKVSATLAEVTHTKRDYVEIASKRDFFYLVRL